MSTEIITPTGINWIMLDPRATVDHLGFILHFLDANNDQDARTQLHIAYAHGGGYHPLPSWKLKHDVKELKYPGDPPLMPLWYAKLRDEGVYVYPHAIVMVLQPDGDFVAARMD